MSDAEHYVRLEHYVRREQYFARVLGIADGGRYRNDWIVRLEGLLKAEGELERLRDGMRALGFIVGRNPDGVDDTVDAALLALAEYRDTLARLREAAQALLDVAAVVGAGPSEFDALRAALTSTNESDDRQEQT